MRSDLERKRMSLVYGELYSAQARERVYRHLLVCAEASLAAGLCTIVDASFLNLADRQAFRALAGRRQAGFSIIACMADRAELIRRIGARSARDPSDADVTVLETQLHRIQALTPDEEACVIRIDTTASDWQQQFRAASG
jgi:predicted kinase